MFAPLAIAARVWGPTRSYARRAIETAFALIFSKLAIAVTLATGASVMSGEGEAGGAIQMIQGAAMLMLAAYMPFALMRVIPVMEAAIAGDGVARAMGTKAAVAGYALSRAASTVAGPVSGASAAATAAWSAARRTGPAGGGGATGPTPRAPGAAPGSGSGSPGTTAATNATPTIRAAETSAGARRPLSNAPSTSPAPGRSTSRLAEPDRAKGGDAP